MFETANYRAIEAIILKYDMISPPPQLLAEPRAHLHPDLIWFGPIHTYLVECKNLWNHEHYRKLDASYANEILSKEWDLPRYYLRHSSRAGHHRLKLSEQVYSPIRVLSIAVPSLLTSDARQLLSPFVFASSNHGWYWNPNLPNDPEPSCKDPALNNLLSDWGNIVLRNELS